MEFNLRQNVSRNYLPEYFYQRDKVMKIYQQRWSSIELELD